ncbi:ATP-binding protein [Actinophytocola oryzae]|uniref:Uncharacterized protein n=1 Tax=Actinophytocola oryzae TaxID=502181 RepID=A0A4R7V4C1_9PSEU|nr:ATP-binding protein [Actinophytocola oryzae]TDV44199.1 hypothetical protein CLV71_114108 [Actinophytocola oryzae]
MNLVEQVLRAIQGHPVNPAEFERCACALLRTRYPGVSAVEGGHDFGRDADIYFPSDDGDPQRLGRLLATIGDPVANLRNGLKRMSQEGLRVDLIVMACLQPVNATKLAKLDKLCHSYGLPAPQVYSRDWFVNELVSEPEWRQRLLGVGGQLELLLERPLDVLEPAAPALTLVGREVELSTLRKLVDDRTDVMLVGVPGVGKTRLATELGDDVLFLQGGEPGQVLDAVVGTRPAAVVVDDAHSRAPDLQVLRRIRVQEQTTFSIIATTWPDQAEDVRTALPSAQVVVIDLLERKNMDVLIRAAGVTGHRARVVVLDQAEGRPGWALALCEVLVNGGGQDIVTGSAHRANVERYLRRVTESPTALDVLACLAALGTLSGETAYQLAPLVGIPPAELTGLLDRLARHGLLDSTPYGWSLQPSLRAPLVARWFFTEPTHRPWDSLVQTFPDHHRALTAAAIAAARTGSALAHQAVRAIAASLLAPGTGEEVDFGLLAQYSTIDEHTARQAVIQALAALSTPRPTHQIGGFHFDPIARSATTLLIRAARQWLLPEAVSALLDLAIGDTRARHSTQEHPLRVLGDLARIIDPDHGTSIQIRERVLTLTLGWLTANPDPAHWTVATKMLATLFSPEVSGTWSDPGDLNTFSYSQGYDTATNLEQLLDLWTQVDNLLTVHPDKVMTVCPPEALCPLIDLVSEWFRLAAGVRFDARELRPEQRQAARAGARRILRTLRPVVRAVPGLAVRAQRVLDNRPTDDQDDNAPIAAFQLDSDLVDLLGGTREPDEDTAGWIEARHLRLDQLAQRITSLGPAAGITRYTDLTHAACLATHSLDGHATLLALRIAPHMTDPAAWVRLANQHRNPALLHAAIQQILKAAPEAVPVEELITHMSDPGLRAAIVSVAVDRSDVDEFTDQVINDLGTADAPLLDRHLRTDSPTDVLHRLLTHPNPAIATAAALEFADAQPYGPTLPDAWKDDWRAAIQDMNVEDMDQHARWKATRVLEHLATNDPDLFEYWFARQLDYQKTREYLRPPEPDGCTELLTHLPREHRERLTRQYAQLLHLPRTHITLLTHLVGHDRDLAERLLDEKVITTEHLLDAVTGQRGIVLEQLGPLLLDRGADPDHIAEHAGVLLGARFGSESFHHKHLLHFFQMLSEKEPGLLPVAEAGCIRQKTLRDKAEEQERRGRVRGV